MLSADGRAVTWIRTTGPAGGAAGNPHPYVGQVRVAPVAGPVQPGTPITSVGSSIDIAGRLGWPDSVAVDAIPPRAARAPPARPRAVAEALRPRIWVSTTRWASI